MIGGKITGLEFHAFLHPRYTINEITKQKTNLSSNFYEEYYKDAYASDHKVLEQFKNFVNQSVIVTHNASKDMEFISKELVKLESTLLFLDISDNPEVGSEGLKEIGKLIYNNKSLRSIGLDGMNLSINNYLPIFNGIFKNKTIEYYSMSKNEGLPLKGILNFFLKNPQVKKINIIPWDRENEEDNEESKFSEEEIFLLEKFHLKAPNVILEGINFIDN